MGTLFSGTCLWSNSSHQHCQLVCIPILITDSFPDWLRDRDHFRNSFWNGVIITRFTWEARARSVSQDNQRLWWNSFWSGFVDTLWFRTYTPSETVNFHFSRPAEFDVTLSHVTDFPNARWALRFRFFHKFRKKSKKVVQKAGTGWCLHLWLIDLKRGHFWSSFRIMRQTTKAHRACPPPQILPAKSDYFPRRREEKNRISKVLICQSQRKERFAQIAPHFCLKTIRSNLRP